ncbi:MAG: TolC family protein [Terrimonas sp.]|nr:TolC family protein [Terrimonas sp.]
MQRILKQKLFVLLLIVAGSPLSAQEILNRYIGEGLSNNLLLIEKKGNLEKSLLSLKEAKSLFLPTTWLETQYTLASGGRSIDIPVGDLLNPVYTTLNQLTSSNAFPKIANVSEQLTPDNFYDARIKTILPLINPDLHINRDIKEQQVSLQQNEIEIYKRELVREIKTAYYQYRMATQAISIYENALVVVRQNVKVNQSLLDNGKGLYAYISRAESEVSTVEAELQSAKNDQNNAQAYFNFLLNKPLSDPILTDPVNMQAIVYTDLPVPDSTVVNKREEIKGLQIARSIGNNVLKMNRAYGTPRLNTFLDLGSQGFDFKVNNKSFFYLAGLQLQVPLFTGKRNLYKIGQTQIDLKNLSVTTTHTLKQLELAAFVSRNNVLNAYHNYLSAVKQQEAAQRYFTLIDRGYKEGINSFIEQLDARNQLTGSQLQVNIQTFRYYSALADYERQTATYSFNQ